MTGAPIHGPAKSSVGMVHHPVLHMMEDYREADGGGGGKSPETVSMPSAFHLSPDPDSDDGGYLVRYCRLYFGRQALTCADAAVGLDEPGLSVYAVVDAVSGTSAVSLRLSVIETDDGDLDPLSTSQCRFLLYRNEDGTIVDYRNTPVVVAMD